MMTHQQVLACEIDAELRRLGYQILDHHQISTKEFVLRFAVDDERGWLFLMLQPSSVSWLPSSMVHGEAAYWLYLPEENLLCILNQLRAMKAVAV